MVFIHRSIKTRIETFYSYSLRLLSRGFLYIDPLKQGLKHYIEREETIAEAKVFIHRSIKTRIETADFLKKLEPILMFLYIDPLKQGLKP